MFQCYGISYSSLGLELELKTTPISLQRFLHFASLYIILYKQATFELFDKFGIVYAKHALSIYVF